VSFSVKISIYIGIFDLDRKLLPRTKTKQRNFCEKKIRRFVDSGIVKICDGLDLCCISDK
jgi:hypothetical protein